MSTQKIIDLFKPCGLNLTPNDITTPRRHDGPGIFPVVSGNAVKSWLAQKRPGPKGYAVWAVDGGTAIHFFQYPKWVTG